jgi:hypothetical protein
MPNINAWVEKWMPCDMFWTPRIPRSEYTIKLRGNEEYHFENWENKFFVTKSLWKIVSECNIYDSYMENVVLSLW